MRINGSYINISSKWIAIILFIILLILDYILFVIYQNINPDLSFYAQIFGFFESKPFQIFTISIILPILLFLIADVFKIKEKRIEEKKERQIKSINMTQELWNDLTELTTEFVYTEKFDESKIAQLNSKISEFIIKAENVVNSWHFEFSDLKIVLSDEVDFTDVYLVPFNVLLSCLNSIIDFRNLDEFYNEEEIQITQKQEYIYLIYEGIKGAAHHLTMRILKNSMLFSENPSKKRKQQIMDDFKHLKKFSFILIKIVYENYPMEDSEGSFKEINDYIKKIKNDESYNYENFRDEIEILYNSLPDDKKLSLRHNYYFSIDLIEQFAYILKIQEVSADFDYTRTQYMNLKD